jgi:hypothetical protein
MYNGVDTFEPFGIRKAFMNIPLDMLRISRFLSRRKQQVVTVGCKALLQLFADHSTGTGN